MMTAPRTPDARMTTIDWVVFALYLAFVVALGVVAGRRGSASAGGFFVAGRSMPWWAVGLSVMATQASAITVIGTTGKAYDDGLRFVQFYFGLPVAMVILAVTLVPVYHRAEVFTAYEFLGRRFDGKTRALTAVLFLVSRGLALGVVVYAPSVVLSLLLGWTVTSTVLVMAAAAILYTSIGGIRAVIWTDVLQMVLIVAGLVVCALQMLAGLPADVDAGDAWRLAEASGHTTWLSTSFDPADRYTVWSGLLGGTFLFLAYFGCDQSQVQRFLTSRSLRDSRLALAFNGLLKIPVQLGVLGLGSLLFVFHVFEPPALLFDPGGREALTPAAYDAFDDRHDDAVSARRDAAVALLAGDDGGREAFAAAQRDLATVRADTLAAVRRSDPTYDDTNHVFPRFMLERLPIGLVGLLIAVVFAAAMSSMDSELNSLSTSTVVDLWQRYVTPDADDAALLRASRAATIAWGVLAAAFAIWARQLGSVIEAVNTVGSYFYGSLLGVFVLAVASKRTNGHGAFVGLLAGMASVAAASRFDVAWLWLNPIGAGVVVVVGWLVGRVTQRTEATA